MWNINIRKGTIWSIKSLNEYDDYYEGMKYGSYKVLILSAYTNQYNEKIFTYLEIPNRKRDNKIYVDISSNKEQYSVELNTLMTGDQNALDHFIGSVSISDMNKVIKEARNHFNLQNYKEDRKVTTKKIEDEDIPQQRLFKFGINVYITENENVHINKAKKIILSKKAKEDIIYNSKTDEDIRLLCDKYKIYPMKAIKEIRNRLVYQHKQKEG